MRVSPTTALSAALPNQWPSASEACANHCNTCPFRKAIEHLPHQTHRPLSSVKIDPEEFLDADDRGHENRARHGLLCENDGMRTEILPPDLVTRFGFLLLCQFEFLNRLVQRTLHCFRGCLQCMRQHVQKVFRSCEVTVAQDVYPAN